MRRRAPRTAHRPTAGRRLVCIAAALVLVSACAKKPPSAPEPALHPPPDPSLMGPAPSGVCKRVVSLEVHKGARELRASCRGGGELVFPIALSRGRGPKRVRGDERMPEGSYRVAGPARRSRFHLFIPIDYPSRKDADHALADGRIDRSAHTAIVRAHQAGRMPPQDTPLGGHLGIHGEGPRWRGELALNWTEGCVAVSDRDIERLARIVGRGTPIRIEP